jgi:hypothetical protein
VIDRRSTLLASLGAATLASSGGQATTAVSDRQIMHMLISKFLITLNIADFDSLLNQLPEGYTGGKGTFGYEFSNRYGVVDYFRKITSKKQQYRPLGDPSVLSDYVAVQLVEVDVSEEEQLPAGTGPLTAAKRRPWLFAFSFSREFSMVTGTGDLIIQRVSVVDSI